MTPVIGVSVLAPSHRLPNLDTLDALEEVAVPVQVSYGERDRVVDSTPVAERAAGLGHLVEPLSADHHFVSQQQKVGRRVDGFFVDPIDETA